jgi:anti-anti-sigma factor
MQFDSELLAHGIIKVNLAGRMDMEGVQAIDMKLTALTFIKKGLVLVDLSEVNFLVSLGIRILLSSTKALTSRGGYLALCNPQPNVLEVLNISGVSTLIPIYDNQEQAVEAMARHQGLC